MSSEQSWHVGLTRLVPPIRGGRWICGAVLFGSLIGLFTLSGVFEPEYRARGSRSTSAALFFSAILAYIVPVFHFISERTVSALEVLRSNRTADPDTIQRAEGQIHRKPRGWFVVVLGLGAAAAVLHNLLLDRSPRDLLPEPSRSTADVALMLGTGLTWLTMTLVVSALLDNARVLAGLAREVRIQLLNPERLRPFATIAVLSTLALIGAQAAFPILMIDGDVGLVAFIPGMIATAVPMVLMATWPIWPLHQRLADARRSLLDDLNRRIANAPPPDPGRPETLVRLAPLLSYRREILDVSEWPFDLGTMTRLGLYLIIPPLTWVGAALIERVVDAVW
jgi:hypothetical protein